MIERTLKLAFGDIGTKTEVILTALPPALRLNIRAGEAARAAIGEVLGVTLPVIACRSVQSGERAALWLGPDEWLVLGPEGPVPEFGANEASIVDISHRQIALAVAGPRAADVLNAFCPLDLSLAAFPVGICTRTLFGKAEIVLWRTAASTFHVEVWRSFAPYVVGCLEEARLEYSDSAADP